MTNPQTILKNIFGYRAFRPGQEKVINLVLKKQNVLAVMPTGAGKSLCYQIPALINKGLTIVISPLISLMKDQIDSLKQNGINAAALNLATPQEEVNPILRAAYREIMAGIDSLKSRPNILALTATATPAVQEDIGQQLAIPKKNFVVTSFVRPNLSFQVVNSPKDTDLYIYNYINNNSKDAGIIYTYTRKRVEQLAQYLARKKINVAAYHGGMDTETRSKVQDDFRYDRVRVIVATNAFGMGIDKSNVRFVIHANGARNLESYYQEAGRASRDGKRQVFRKSTPKNASELLEISDIGQQIASSRANVISLARIKLSGLKEQMVIIGLMLLLKLKLLEILIKLLARLLITLKLRPCRKPAIIKLGPF